MKDLSEQRQSNVKARALEVRLLGGFEVFDDGRPVTIPSRKARALLAYVAAQPRPTTRAKLAELLWPESSPDRGRASVRQALYLVRSELGSHLVATSDRVVLERASVDVREFRDHLRRGEGDVERFLAIYRGEFLDGFEAPTTEFGRWTGGVRRRVRQQAIERLEAASRGVDGEDAIAAGQRLVELEPLREDIHRLLMELHADAGRIDAALRQYRDCEQALRRELNAMPAKETLELRDAIKERRRGEERETSVRLSQRRSFTVIAAGPPSGAADSDELRSTLRAAICDFDAVMLQGMPGVVTAGFGVASPRPRDAEVAVSAAAAIRDRLGEQVAIGVASGEGAVERVDDRWEVDGGPSRVASRLQVLAAPGEVRIDEQSARGLPPAAVLERDAGWALARVPKSAFGPRQSGPLVGREMELDVIGRGLDQAAERAVAVVVSGDAGIGKTRVVLDALSENDVHTLRVSADRTGRAGSSDPISMVMRRAIETAEELGLTLPDRVRRAAEGPGRGGMQPEDFQRSDRQIGAARMVLCQLAGRRNIAVWLDDADAFDGSVGSLAELATVLRNDPVAFILTSRDLLGDFAPAIPTVRLALSPLDAASASKLAERLGIDPAEIEDHVRRSGGNPLFLEQLAELDLLEGGERLPHTVRSTVLASVADCSAEQRRALRAGAVLGRRFGAEELAFVANEEVEVLSLLATRLVSMTESGELEFVHSVAREAIEESLAPEVRGRLHRRAAEYHSEHLAVHAEHLAAAGDERALAAFADAVRDRAARRSWSEVLSIASRAQECGGGESLWEIELHAARAEQQVGNIESSVARFRELAREAIDEHGRSRALLGVASGLRLLGRAEEALRSLELAAEEARRADDIELEGRVHYLRGSVLFPAGQIEESAAEHRRALEIAQRMADPQLEARARSGLGDALYMSGRMSEARGEFRRCVELAREHHMTAIRVANLPMVGLTGFYSGEAENALEPVEAARREAGEEGLRRAELVATNVACDVLLFRADWPRLLERARRTLALAGELGSQQFAGLARAYRGFANVALGHRRRGERELARACEFVVRYGAEFAGPHVFGLRAAVAGDEETLRDAIGRGEQMLASNRVSHNQLLFRPLAMVGLARHGATGGFERQAEALSQFAGDFVPAWTTWVGEVAEALEEGAFEEAATRASDRGIRLFELLDDAPVSGS